MKDQSIDKILDLALKDKDLTYEIRDKIILIYNSNTLRNELTGLQQQKLSGTVTDASTGEAIVGANVIIDGTTIGVVTDANGKFSITVPNPNAILIVSFLGYNTEKITITGQNDINVMLVPDITKLEEVIVVGYGTQSKRNVSGSVSNLSERDFNRGITQTAADLLQGKIAGLTITTEGGDVTSAQTIRLRGASSLTGSSAPFVVIDGVPGMDMNSIAPEDIESISILKDASATAIYGSRSASGVILITTKRENKVNQIFSIAVMLLLILLHENQMYLLLQNGVNMSRIIILMYLGWTWVPIPIGLRK
ncbi:MAG: TonB-dependent receptor plug domain-containing protein [Bacteroidales bacterium]|nr:TonB-dependent receptor plug domain-containing protein [Bacteroidales bacterium]